MHSKKLVGLSLCAALTFTGAVAPSAFATTETGQLKVLINRAEETGSAGYINGTIQPNSLGTFTYTHPDSAQSPFAFKLAQPVAVDGVNIQVDWATQPETSRDGNADVVTYTQDHGDVTVSRSYKVVGSRVEASARLTNNGDTEVAVHAQSSIRSGAELKEAGNGGYIFESASYLLRTGFDGAETRDSAGAVLGDWKATLQPGEVLETEATAVASSRGPALDFDGDGLRDAWEANGLRVGNTNLPINEWGADQRRKDVFLQLNWMKSEWETLECKRTERFAPTVEDFTKFAACATANTKDYTPDPTILKELEELFEDHGINLHIDAGGAYVSESMTSMPDKKGGGTVKYEAEYFKGMGHTDRAEKLERQAKQLLGDRRSVFRAGLIGTRFENGNGTSGLGQTNGSAFFVASDVLSSRDHLKGTILHEFGHTLGLKHYGRNTGENNVEQAVMWPDRQPRGYSYLEGYKSAMSYAHQFRTPDFTAENTQVTGEVIPNGSDRDWLRPPRQAIDYFIPSDWDNLNLANGIIGSGVATFSDDPDLDIEETVTEPEEAEVDDLILAAAPANNGKAGFQLDMATGTGIVTQADNNVLRGRVLNLGTKADTFTVTANYDGRISKQTVDVAGTVRDKVQSEPVELEVSPAAFMDKPQVPVTITVANSKGEKVFEDTFNVSVLDYTREEAAKVLAAVLASDASDEVKEFAKQKLSPAEAQAKKVDVPKPAERPSTGQGTGTEQSQSSIGSSEAGSSASPWAIAVTAVLALTGLAVAGFGWAVDQGIIKLP